MVENLRYYISNGRIIVKWNWLGDNNMTATCRLVKRLNNKEVDCVDDITMTAYWNGRGGCSFTMPSVPVRVELTDSMQSFVSTDIWESPRYSVRVNYRLQNKTERYGLLGLKTRTASYMRIRLEFPETLEQDEIKQIEGWVISGYASHQPNKRFFLPRPSTRVMEIPPFEITPEEAKDDYCFEIIPDVRGTLFDRLFLLNSNNEPGAEHEPDTLGTMHFDRLARREANGYYKVICPYCFAEYGYDAPVFRALSFSNSSNGFTQEIDKKYDTFCKGRIETDRNLKRGKVLEWGDTESICKIAYAAAPSVMVDYTPDAETRDVVVIVEDRYGNRTSQKICPECHHNIPLYSGMYPNLFISMMGNTGSGKTVYMASMINMLRSGQLLPGYNFICRVCPNLQSREIERSYSILIEGQEAYDEFGAVPMVEQSPNDGHWETQDLGMPSSNSTDISSKFDSFMSAQPVSPMGFTSAEPVEELSSDADTFGIDTSFSNDGFVLPQDSTFLLTPGMTAEAEFDSIPLNEPGIDMMMDQLDLSTMAVPEQTDQHNGGKRLYEATTRSYLEPCIYELIGTDPKTKEKVGFSLSFFDFPGEAIWYLDSPDSKLTDNDKRLIETINHAAGLIFLFDPSSLERVRKLTDERKSGLWQLTLAGKEESSLKTLLSQRPNHILNSFRRKFTNGITKLEVPVAMVISKSDAIRDWLKKEDPSLQNVDTFFLEEDVNALDNTRTELNLSGLRKASDAISAFLGDVELEKSCQDILGRDNYLWICVSATGIAPDSKGTLFQRHGVPIHLLDPVEWILYRTMETFEQRVES